MPRAVQPWLARNSKALDPESMLPETPQVDNYQSSHDETSHTPKSMVSIEETCEADKETDRFLASLAFSRVIEVTLGGTEYGPGNEEEDAR